MIINENHEIWKAFLCENPWNYGVLDDSFEDHMVGMSVENIKKQKHIGNFENMEIYHKVEFGYDEYSIVINDEFAAFLRFEKSKDRINIKLTWNSKNNKGVLRKFLAEYILPKYGVIESGYALSTKAFDMWEKMMLEYPKYDFFVRMDDGDIHQLKFHYDFMKYSKDEFNGGKKHSTFIAKYNN